VEKIRYKLTPAGKKRSNCLILVGGTGDTIEAYQSFADVLSKALKSYSICTTTLSQKSSGISLMDQQSNELMTILDDFRRNETFERKDLWCTSMGAYATTKVLLDPSYVQYFTKAIFFDPADYYLDSEITNTGGNLTWAGYQDYHPQNPTIVTELPKIKSQASIDVVRLTLRNQNEKGYYDEKYIDRGIDHKGGFPRLNSQMVKTFYNNVPRTNKGKYLELGNVPHGFIRDGDIPMNMQLIARNTKKLLTV
jgi:hypothetical protein